MIFANAIYLWGLLGLLLPIAIHLWSRKKVKTIKIGSIKLLEASKPKQTSNLKINEFWLLLLRLLTILLLVFILAEPSIITKEKNIAISYLVESSLGDDERMRSILDTIPKESVRILENGFPKWDDDNFEEFSEQPLYWQLAQEMQSISSDSIVVFSKGLRKGLKGKRPSIQANTRWIVLESQKIHEEVAEATNKESYTEVLSFSGDKSALSFKKDSIALDSDLIEIGAGGDSLRVLTSEKNDWLAFENERPIKIGILKNDFLVDQMPFFRAAYRGIAQFLNKPLRIQILSDASSLEGYHTIISFKDKPTLPSNTNLLLYRPNDLANQLITEGPSKNVFHLNGLLDNENIVDEHLPEALMKLINLRTGFENTISSNDLRTVSESEIQPLKLKAKPIKNIASIVQISSWLWLILILAVIVERILSKVRKQ